MKKFDILFIMDFILILKYFIKILFILITEFLGAS